MATMKIGTTSQAYGDADYSFQVNPLIVNIPFKENYSVFDIPYSKTHIFLGSGGVGVRKLVLTGHTHGTSKLTHFNNLAKELHAHAVKRFWISSTKFYNVIGSEINHTFQGGRTNFIDYIGSVDCIIPYCLGGTASTYTWTTTGSSKTALNDATGGSSGAFTNAGNAPAFVQWQIVNTTGSAITKIEIGDTSDFATSPHKLEWTGSLTSGNTLLIEIFNYASQGTRGTFKEMRYAYPTVSGTKTGNVLLKGEAMPWIDAEATDQAFCIQLTGNDNTAVVTATWNPSYVG